MLNGVQKITVALDWGSFYGSDVVPSECILYMFDVYDWCDCDGMFVSDILLYPSVLNVCF